MEPGVKFNTMINLNSALAVVEQVNDMFGKRWHYILRDEEGTVVHRGMERTLKSEAIGDRSEMVRQANEWRRRVGQGYADEDAVHTKMLRVALRAVYLTQDPHD